MLRGVISCVWLTLGGLVLLRASAHRRSSDEFISVCHLFIIISSLNFQNYLYAIFGHFDIFTYFEKWKSGIFKNAKAVSLRNLVGPYKKWCHDQHRFYNARRRRHRYCMLDCIDEVTCDVVISNCWQSVSHSDSTLLGTNPELHNEEIRWNNAISPHSGMAKNGKSLDFWQIWQ